MIKYNRKWIKLLVHINNFKDLLNTKTDDKNK